MSASLLETNKESGCNFWKRMETKYDTKDTQKLYEMFSLEDLCEAFGIKPRKVSYIPFGEKEAKEFIIHTSDPSEHRSNFFIYVKDVIKMVFGESDPNFLKYMAPFYSEARCLPASCINLKEAWYPSHERHLDVMVYDPKPYTHFVKQGGINMIINQIKGLPNEYDFLQSLNPEISDIREKLQNYLKSRSLLHDEELLNKLVIHIKNKLNE